MSEKMTSWHPGEIVPASGIYECLDHGVESGAQFVTVGRDLFGSGGGVGELLLGGGVGGRRRGWIGNCCIRHCSFN
jgi:hypothetical protein